MDYTTWSDFPQNQTQTEIQTPLSSYPPSVHSYPNLPPSSSYCPTYPQNPDPSSSSSLVVNPPGVVDSYAPLMTTHHHHVGQEALPNPNFSYGHTHTHVVDSSTLVPSSGYFFHPNAQNWAAREAVKLYGADPATYGPVISMPSKGLEQLAVANPNSAWWTNSTAQPHGNGTWKKYQKKAKTKMVQSAYCEVCKIECNSKDVLDQHKLGKKHKKNLEKLRESLRPPQVHPSGSSNPVIGPQVQNDTSKSVSVLKRKTVGTPEDLETKKMKVLEGGAAAESVRICSVCNVVCNSDTVYNYHLAGQKHAATMKKVSEYTQSNAR